MSIALILHDPDVAIGSDDVLHRAIFNIPATATGLPEGVPAKAMLDDGTVQIDNIGGSIGYFDPCPPRIITCSSSMRWIRSWTRLRRTAPIF